MAKTIEELQSICDQFPEEFQSASLSTYSKENKPLASYAPFVYANKTFYFLISKIAPHYQNLVNHPTFSFNLLQDESKASSIFFRQRLTYQAVAHFPEIAEELKSAFVARFGEMATMLFGLDFAIVKAELLEGSMVLGAGQAYQINANQKVQEQIKSPHGHGHQK